MDLSTLNGSSLALLMLLREPSDNRHVVIHGKAYWTGKELLLDPGDGHSTLTIPPVALTRIEAMDEEAEEIVGDAQYWTWVMVGVQAKTMPSYQPTLGQA